jgi:hypothetical protein
MEGDVDESQDDDPDPSVRGYRLMKFPFPILPGYVTYYVVNC